ncbi:acyltransferase family protein [uncultured Microbacterium sp.]|uniref:acyltransferase family protein n=1 Tax=uncultured Microbacterium sp. TaxID=191216 RepID=UPI0025DB8640|nr:acyltransferase family protein [uncultured Microbacterium sp.]
MSVQLSPVRSRARRESRSVRILPEIQGLRAVAVALVVLFHLWPNRLPGGFVGVDVFFVISGFLITAHLLREVERTGRVRVIQFWGRRIRRLLPASLFVLAMIGVATFFVGPLSAWPTIFRHIAASSVYVENWALAADSVDYWAQAVAAPPTQHYWSLSVEEQFYFVWPIVFAAVALAVRAARGRFLGLARVVLGVIVLASFAYSVWYSATNPSVAYFSTFTRAWEFGLGGMLALVGLTELRLGALPRAIIGWVGIALIALAALIIRSSDPFPGAIALLPVVGTVAVILAGTTGARGSFDAAASWRPVQFIGDVSYSVYLWHWPLIVMLPWVLGPLSTALKLAIIVASVILAYATKRFIEDPARNATWLTARRAVPTFLAAAAASALLVGASAVAPAVGQQMVASRLADANAFAVTTCAGATAVVDPSCSADAAPVPAADIVFGDADPEIEKCFSQDSNGELIRCSFGDAAAPAGRVALVGDSHAGALAPAMMRLAAERGWALDVYLKPGCPWSQTTRFRPDNNVAAIENCSSWRDAASAALTDPNRHYDFVVTTSYAIVGNMVEADAQGTPYDASVAGLRASWGDFIARTGAPVLVVRDNPNWDRSPVDCLMATRNPGECTESEAQAFSNPDPQIAAAAQTPGVGLIDLTEIYCPQGICAADLGGITAYRDAHHLSRSFALSLAPVLGQRIDTALAALPSAPTKGSSG